MKLRLLLLFAIFAGVAGVPTPAAQAADPTTPESATPLTSAPPFYSYESVDRTADQIGAGAGNEAVSAACNAGQPIYATRWWRFSPPATTTVVARGHLFFETGRVSNPGLNGVALVSTGGPVLDCNIQSGVSQTDPIHVAAGTSLYLVSFLVSSVECTGEWLCYDAHRGFGVKPTDGVRPANDDWQNATAISSLPFSQSSDTTLGTMQPEDYASDAYPCEPGSVADHYSQFVRSSWWRYQPTVSGPIVLSLNGRILARDEASDPTVLIARLTPSGPDFSGSCALGHPPILQAGLTYLIQVSHPIHIYGNDSVEIGTPFTLGVAAARQPAAPTGVTATVNFTARTATINWAPPVANDGPPVSGYHVARDGTDSGGTGPWSTTVGASVRSQTFSYLLPGATYALTVQAINPVGTGPAASITVTLTPPTGAAVPGAPTALAVATADAAQTATITWSPPASDGGAVITGYRVARDGTDSGGGGPWSTTLGAAARSHTFTLLSPGGTYTLSVQALNAVGAGATASVAVVIPAPAAPAPPPAFAPPVVPPPAVVPPPVVVPTPVVVQPAPVLVTAPPVAPRPAVNRSIRITKVRYNPPGTDTRRNINGEYLRLRNTGTRTVALTGWTLQTAARTTYTFRATRLRAGAVLTLFTGKGTATSSSRYWGRTKHVWRNAEIDSARLRDQYSRGIDSCAWTARARGYKNC